MEDLPAKTVRATDVTVTAGVPLNPSEESLTARTTSATLVDPLSPAGALRPKTPPPAPERTQGQAPQTESFRMPESAAPLCPQAARRSLSSASMPSGLSTPPQERATNAMGHSFQRTESGHSRLLCAEERAKALRIVPNADHLRNHFVYVDLSAAHEHPAWSSEAFAESKLAKAADYFDAIRPARQHSPINQIVLLANEPSFDYLCMMWEDELSGPLNVIRGCGLFLSDLRKCNLGEAAGAVVFSAGERCDNHGDSITILVSKSIRELAREGKDATVADIPITVELDHTRYVPLVGSGTRVDCGNEAGDWVMDPSFLSGSVVCRHILDTLPQETYFIPEVRQVLEQLLFGRGDALSVTSLAVQSTWTTYSHIITYCVERRLLPLAIHRLHEDPANSFRFIITNPPGPFPVVSTDILYCLKIK